MKCLSFDIIISVHFVCQKSVEPLQKFFEKYVTKVLDFRCTNCKELVPTGELNAVTSLCYLLDALATSENGVCQVERNLILDTYLYLCLCVVWVQGNGLHIAHM